MMTNARVSESYRDQPGTSVLNRSRFSIEAAIPAAAPLGLDEAIGLLSPGMLEEKPLPDMLKETALARSVREAPDRPADRHGDQDAVVVAWRAMEEVT